MHFIDMPNVSFLLDELNPFLFQRIKNEAKTWKQHFIQTEGLEDSKDLLRAFQKRKFGDTEEYTLSEDTIKLLTVDLFKLVDKFEEKYKYFDKMFNYSFNIENKNIKLELERVWFNFQRPGEFLPLHNHTGIYSFVIWVDIPFNAEDEKDKETNTDLVKNRTSNFEFIFTDVLGKISHHALYVDKKWEGKIAMFPAELYHQVYPFYSVNDVRISLAGNIRLNIV